ncbi:helix-turn-helix domain-containing protein [Sphaerisporangium rubeum]|uniref:DNA-binding transcriptional ArsR family regulator n=1 Tax=Sphaerisporangium rubeum TaxID=321317 RepID=A0A7X0M643_9ACTN|nr:helix-turn-helix domain-containing protein [Sphaerisporangium rubeum]MBB6473060.1 DNA-binding transcriptional ArsR family regulator [Sphaerisporangium rubeum]
MERKSFSARALDAHTLKSFAHPTRLRLYELLDAGGPSTATRLAEHLHENTGVTSYHLRELAKHGMIEQVPGLGKGKEKYWRVTPGGYSVGPPPDDEPETASAIEILTDHVVHHRATELTRWREEESTLPPEWKEAGGLSRRSLRLTPEETITLSHQIQEILTTYRTLSDHRESETPLVPPPDTTRVVIHFDVLPAHPEGTPQ